MPNGIPVATVAVDGARNAGILAAQILGANNDEIFLKLLAYKVRLAEKVEEMALEMEDPTDVKKR